MQEIPSPVPSSVQTATQPTILSVPPSPEVAKVLTTPTGEICPTCHFAVKSTDYFCSNCGHNLKPKPLSTSILKQLSLYIGAVLLPPFGIIWGWPYLKEQSTKGKMMGIIAILLTVISFVGSTYYALQFANNINEQVNQEMSRIQGFK